MARSLTDAFEQVLAEFGLTEARASARKALEEALDRRVASSMRRAPKGADQIYETIAEFEKHRPNDDRLRGAVWETTQKQIRDLIGEGYTTPEIAAELTVPLTTIRMVRAHVTRGTYAAA